MGSALLAAAFSAHSLEPQQPSLPSPVQPSSPCLQAVLSVHASAQDLVVSVAATVVVLASSEQAVSLEQQPSALASDLLATAVVFTALSEQAALLEQQPSALVVLATVLAFSPVPQQQPSDFASDVVEVATVVASLQDLSLEQPPRAQDLSADLVELVALTTWTALPVEQAEHPPRAR